MITLDVIRSAGVRVGLKGDQLSLKGNYDALIADIKASKPDILSALQAEWKAQVTGLELMIVEAANEGADERIRGLCSELSDLVLSILAVREDHLRFQELISANKLRVERLLLAIRSGKKSALLEGDALAGVVPKILDVRKPLPTSAPVAPLFHKEPVVVDHSQMSLTAPVFEANLEDI